MASADDADGGPVAPLPQLGDAPFSLLRVRGGNATGANAGAFGCSLSDLVVAPPPNVSDDSLRYALVSNMMIDAAWLFSALPGLLQAKRLVVVQADGHASDTRAAAKALGAASESVPTPSPPLFNQYSSHHGKFFLLFYETGMRLVITSANFIDPDCNRKTQSVFAQDFPRRWPQTDDEKLAARGGQFLGARIMGMEGAEPLPAARCPYEKYLRDYLFVALSAHPSLREEVALLLREHDFSSARADLCASVPGVHSGSHIDKWGHMRVRSLLAADPRPMPARFASAAGGRTAAQCSSLGACYASFLAEMGVSFAGGSGPGASAPAKRKRGGGAGGGKKKKKAGGKKGRSEDEDEEDEDDDDGGGGGGGPASDRIDDLFWTTVEEVSRSVEGWRAGLSIPASAANATRNTLQSLFRRWGDGSPARRELYAPHIKTFARYLPPPPAPPPAPSAAAAAAAAALARSNNGNNNDGSSNAATAAAAAAAVPAEVAHVYVGSSNLSMAAWGQLQLEGSQLKVLSYEMGVLITPSREARWRAHPDRAFNATPWQPACAALAARQQQAQQRERDECGGCSLQALGAREVVLFAWHAQCRPGALLNSGSRRPDAPPPGCDPSLPPLLVPLPLPFSLRAPRRYGPQDTPWDVDTPWPGNDSRGRAWAECRATRFYGVVDPTPQEEPW